MTEDEMQRLAQHIVKAQGPLAGVTPETAQERLTNLMDHDHDWATRMHNGEMKATQEFRTLTQMVADHQASMQRQEYETAKATFDQETATELARVEKEKAESAANIDRIQRGETT